MIYIRHIWGVEHGVYLVRFLGSHPRKNKQSSTPMLSLAFGMYFCVFCNAFACMLALHGHSQKLWKGESTETWQRSQNGETNWWMECTRSLVQKAPVMVVSRAHLSEYLSLFVCSESMPSKSRTSLASVSLFFKFFLCFEHVTWIPKGCFPINIVFHSIPTVMLCSCG